MIYISIVQGGRYDEESYRYFACFYAGDGRYNSPGLWDFFG